jgi:transposase-like protein
VGVRRRAGGTDRQQDDEGEDDRAGHDVHYIGRRAHELQLRFVRSRAG